MARETGSDGRPFPATRHSLVAAVGSRDGEVRRAAFGSLAAVYWKPVYKYLRLRWHAEPADASDLTQSFFTAAFEKDLLARYDASRGRFRTYLRVCLDGFVANERKSAGRLKRGGGTVFVPLDFETAEGELVARPLAAPVDLEQYFHREWVRSLFEQVVAELRQACADEGRGAAFAVFERYDLDAPASDERLRYADLARELGLSVTQVTNHLAAVRREFRRRLLERLRELTATDEEFRAEVVEILGSGG
jgi:DNA-directed RNA polymerase specialized sigma24 family protein